MGVGVFVLYHFCFRIFHLKYFTGIFPAKLTSMLNLRPFGKIKYLIFRLSEPVKAEAKSKKNLLSYKNVLLGISRWDRHEQGNSCQMQQPQFVIYQKYSPEEHLAHWKCTTTGN